MIEQSKLELISAAIDGELDADDRVELDLLLESSEEARELKSELESLDSLLKDVPELKPSDLLHSQIMARVKPVKPQRTSSALNWVLPLIPGYGLRYAIAAAAGALVVAIFISSQSMQPDMIDLKDLVGTMAPDKASGDAHIVDSFALREEGLVTLVQLRLNGTDLLLDIDADTTQRLDISVDLSGTGLWPDALAQIDGRSESISIIGQVLQIETLGEQRLTILLGRVDDAAFTGEAKITLEFSSEGKLHQRGTLTATMKGAR